MADSAYAQQPTDVVMSDALFNTAMGTDVLLHLAGGKYNTASGYGALFYNTTGSYNNASGNLALY
jgi:hypothetical protein